MTVFHYQNGELYAEDVPLSQIADQFGTPCYVYSRAALEQNFQAYEDALTDLPHLTCFAVKSNSNLAVLDVLARRGAGFDIVSGGELARVLAAGGQAERIIFSGLGKTEQEIAQALQAGILCFNVESEPELDRINTVGARLGMIAQISLRVNPDVDAGTHPYISTGLKENKFGIDIAQALSVYQRAADMPNIRITGIDCHIGSQLTSIDPYLDAVDRVLMLVDRLADAGIVLEHFDIGGGLGVVYNNENPPAPHTLINAVSVNNQDHCEEHLYDVVGPVCESGDFLGKERELRIAAGDLLAVKSAGAYGFVMSSNYNTRNRAAEVMVDGSQTRLVRQRETIDYQLSLERTLAD